MKKVTRIIGAICMMGLLTFVSTSCKKNQENGEMTISVAIPDIEVDGEERAYINGNNIFFWHESDFVRVYNLAEEENADESATAIYTKIGGTSTQTARFRGPSLGAKKYHGFRIFYPTCMVQGEDEEIDETLENENRQVFTVADKQYFHFYETPSHHLSKVDGNAMPMAVKVNKLTENATLQHMFGLASFNICAAYGTTVVVDKVELEDKFFNITGDVSVKLHNVATDNSLGEENNLNNVWNAFITYGQQGKTYEEYRQEVLAPYLTNQLGWEPVVETLGKVITLDCIYEHEDGETKGVELAAQPNNTRFNFSLRPLSLSQGFYLRVYVHGQEEPIVFEESDFNYNDEPCDYRWGTKAGKLKTYTREASIN